MAIDSQHQQRSFEAPSTAVAPALEVTGVSKRWRGQDRPVLDSVDLAVPTGSVIWIGGENGAGKTTLLRIIAGILAPDRGHVRVNGHDPDKERREYQRQIGFLSAGSVALYARLTPRQHLQYWARVSFMPRSKRQSRIEQTIEEFKLGDLADRRCDRMSMGQRQRVRLALTFLPEPGLVLLDEPRNSLDTDGYDRLQAAVEASLRRAASLIWCSPAGERTDTAFDQRLMLRDGHLEPA